MFLKNYLNEFYYNQILDNYKIDYLNDLDQDNFNKVYNILTKYKFDYIEDIILNYLELFELEPTYVEEKIIILMKYLGNNYVRIIGKDMRYFTLIIDDSLETKY